MNRLDTYAAFVRVAELSSFTQAAASLGLPKSAVSSAVAALESRLKTQLLYRTTRKVQLTHDGHALYERARDLLSDAEDMDAMFQSQPQALTGTLRVDMPVAMARNFIVPRLPDFFDRHPGLQLELSCTDRRVDVVAEGFDCVIRVGARPDSGLMARQLGVMTMVNVASPAYLERHGTPLTLDDLDHHFMVHYVGQLGAKPWGFEYRDGGDYQTRDVPGRMFVNSTESFQAAAVAGLGIIQSPIAGAAPLLAEGRLVQILPDYEAEPLPVALIYPRRRHQARRVRAFMDWVAAIMGDYLSKS
ncbi:LysR family transcripitonal regulator [Asticcacaulis sp. AC460]|uniref:LysR family transcriptional regulator n=1 Tax=Asticcacaulis sp. AC460 TaxID=1282360 RepID=UPI0003C3E971|nr:LysR family transcriptional regulator [Asticcacaulis sp. AC460]ESQ90757.1 LysR family transcripitonal regulator [Asticcacaulis sp. AC460]